MAENIDIPKVGKVQKKYVFGAIGVVAAYVGWRYYQANQASSSSITTVTPDVNNSDVSASGVIGGEASGNVQYAGTVTNGTGNTILTNAQWTEDAVQKLTGTGGWDSASVYSALGDYLTAKPLTQTEQSIVRAAIAASGKPPVGTFDIIESTGDIVLPAPTGIHLLEPASSSSVHLGWNSVPNAAHYNLYRGDTGGIIMGGATSPTATSGIISGLQPNTSYTATVAAVSTLGKVGTKSVPITFKTASVALKAPGTPKVSGITASQATFTTTSVTGATGYNWWVDGKMRTHSDSPSVSIGSLPKNSKHTVKVQADNATQAPGPFSGSASFTTKK